MAIEISCSTCGAEFRVKDDAAGKSFTCKSCGAKIAIPHLDDDFPQDDFEDENRYASPRSRDDDGHSDRPKRRKKKSSNAGGRTLGPAIGLYVTAGVHFLIILAMSIVRLSSPPVPPAVPVGANEAQANAHKMGYYIGYYGVSIVMPLYELFILAGAFCLHTRKSYAMALMACIFCSIPCCSPLLILGMPFGIWGLVVLFDEDVKRAFS